MEHIRAPRSSVNPPRRSIRGSFNSAPRSPFNSGGGISKCPLNIPVHVCSVRSFGLSFRPKLRLNGLGSLIFQIGVDAGQVEDAALSLCQSLLCFLEFPFCKAHRSEEHTSELQSPCKLV